MKNPIIKSTMTKRLAITAIAMFAIMMGISAIAPAMADRATAPGHNKIDICHFDDEEIQYVLISIPEKAVRAHEKNHDMDIIPAPEDGCPVIEPEPVDTDSDGLTDGDEVNIHGTDPLNSDTDGGGISDGDEVNVDGTDPLDALDDLVIITP
ncbi:MAG: thrombospondin type 3 repeat-containing protein [Nitrosopumilus sp.]|nr:thrombospondin type 3 repeat-containing protein [Nitrosopumilus sp.]